MRDIVYTEKERLRSYSSIFSRAVFSDIIEYNDYSRLDTMRKRYDADKNSFNTYYDYLKYIYRIIAKYYRCEYVYKNEIINKLLIKQYGTTNTIAINEFRVRNTIVDLAMFNGKSKAFEIKTEYDTKKRLGHQIDSYTKLFQECYIVVPMEVVEEYKKVIPNNVGVIGLMYERGRIKLQHVKDATDNEKIDTYILMRSIRTSEYCNIVKSYYNYIPNVSCFELFDKCEELIAQIPTKDLQRLFLAEIKKRNSNTSLLGAFMTEIRQMCLSMNLNKKQYEILHQRLNNIIK